MGMLTIPKLLKEKYVTQNFHIIASSIFFILFSYVIILFLKSTLYNGWRHVFYLFSPLNILAIAFLEYIRTKRSIKSYHIAVLISYVTLIPTMLWGIKSHPHQYVYFNNLAGENWENKWEMDYWGLSGKQLLEFILNTDKEQNITICDLEYENTRRNLLLVEEQLKKRITWDCSAFQDKQEEAPQVARLPKYFFVYESRFIPKVVKENYREIHTINVNKQKISYILQLKSK